jgi:putative methanogenesis marker 16 metalloprotein
LTGRRTTDEINRKIRNGEARIYTAEEFKKLIKKQDTPDFDEVDVVTCGTCGVMSGTAAILNFIVSDPGVFIRASEVYMNGVPAYAGPCPNEWLGSVDVILHGTAHSIYDRSYGGGFLLKDMLEGKSIDVRVESAEGKTIESTITKDDITRSQIIGARMAFKNYTAFTNPGGDAVRSIFAATPLEGNFSGLTFSGCGDINPLQNDIPHNVIKEGSRVLLNGAVGYVLGDGTRSSAEKPNLMLSADLMEMDPYYIGGFKTSQGAEVYDTVAVPIPVLDEEIYNNLLVRDDEIALPVADIRGRHLPLADTDYAKMWEGRDLRPRFDSTRCKSCDSCTVEEICPTNAFKDKRLNPAYCFGCSMCASHCRNGAFDMNAGSVNLTIDDKDVDIPIILRQSDRLRANKLSGKLKKMIENREFIL